jgi:hypothetical protein
MNNYSPHFFKRELDGSVKIRLKLKPEEASMIEEAAGETPVVLWLHRTIGATAKKQVREARRRRPEVAPPS